MNNRIQIETETCLVLFDIAVHGALIADKPLMAS